MQSLHYQRQKMVCSESQKGKVSPIKQIEPILVSGPVEHHPWLSTNLTKCENDFFRMMLLILDRFGLNMFQWFVMKTRNCFYYHYYCHIGDQQIFKNLQEEKEFLKIAISSFLYPSPRQKQRFFFISSPFSFSMWIKIFSCAAKFCSSIFFFSSQIFLFPQDYSQFSPPFSLLNRHSIKWIFAKEKKWYHVPDYFGSMFKYQKVVVHFCIRQQKWPNQEWGKGHFHWWWHEPFFSWAKISLRPFVLSFKSSFLFPTYTLFSRLCIPIF